MRISKRWSLGLLGLLAVLPIAGLAQPDSSAPAAAPAPAVVPEQVHFSPGIKDILKLLDAKVEPSVINSYIKSSTTAYNPTATEIIALKNHGVSDDIIMAVLQRGSEVRTQLAHAAQTAPVPAPSPVQPPYNPDYMQSAPDSYASAGDYGASYPYYSYPYYGYGGGYPYWWWNTWYPWAWWPYSSAFFVHNFHNHSHAFAHGFAHGFNHGVAHGGMVNGGVAHGGVAHGGVARVGFGGGAMMHGGGGGFAMRGGGGFSGGHGGGGGGHGGGGHR